MSFKKQLRESAQISASVVNPRHEKCISDFEEKLISHVNERFATVFRCNIYSNESLFWIKASLKEKKIAYTVTFVVGKKGRNAFGEGITIRSSHHRLKIKPSQWS